MPKVSVILASFNHAAYLSECLDSILRQTYQDIEIVTVDDGSNDASLDILNRYQEEFPQKVRVFTHQDHTNLGISATWNLAIEQASGEYLALLGSDDVWLPSKLEYQVEFLDARSEVGLFHCRAQYMDTKGNLLPRFAGGPISDGNAQEKLLFANPISAVTAIFRRSVFDGIGAFNNELVYSDWEYWLRIARDHNIAFRPDVVARYRIHLSNTSISSLPALALERRMAVVRHVCHMFPELRSFEEPAYAAVYLSAGLRAWTLDKSQQGIDWIQMALALDASLTQPHILIDKIVGYICGAIYLWDRPINERSELVVHLFETLAPQLAPAALANFQKRTNQAAQTAPVARTGSRRIRYWRRVQNRFGIR